MINALLLLINFWDISDGEISTSKPRKEKERKEKQRKEKKSGEKMTSDKPKRVEPSHFIAIQITNSEVTQILKFLLIKKRVSFFTGSVYDICSLQMTLLSELI